jgi:membrane-bound serine protease (ClpP class)
VFRRIAQIGRFVFAVPLVLGAILMLAGSPARAADEDAGRVAVLPTTGIVDAIMAGYLEDGIAKAHRDGANAVVITLDTPGGDLAQTRRIVKSILSAPLPVIVWVSPAGAHAASAGTFITLAGHVALMAPGTNIGAASPVTSSGGDIPETMEKKVVEDTTALMRSITDARGRNAEWAESTITDAEAATAAEALELGAIDGIVNSLDEALEFSDGRTVSVAGQEATVDTAGAETYDLSMNPFQSFLHLLSDPNIAFILITIGFYGLLYEVISPNYVTGIVGAIAIVLAFIGFGSLPLNVGGLLLIALGVVMFLLEFHVVSHGLLTVAGIICFVLGASALYTEPGTPTAPDIRVDPRLIFLFTGLTAAYMAFVLLIVIRWRRRQQAMGAASTALVLADGAVGSVRSALAPTGVVYAAGEEWTARSRDERQITPGTPVRVVGQDGLTLIVEPIEAPG